MSTITVSELRSNLKEILGQVQNGKDYQVTQRGKIIVTMTQARTSSDEFENRIEKYRNGSIQIMGDIINAPLKDLDYINDSVYGYGNDKNYDNIADKPNA